MKFKVYISIAAATFALMFGTVLMPETARSQATEAGFQVRIDTLTEIMPGPVPFMRKIHLEVSINKALDEISGFQFRFAFDNEIFRLRRVLHSVDRYEYFSHSFWPPDYLGEGYPATVVRVAGTVSPEAAAGGYRDSVLFDMVFSFSESWHLACQSVPIRFFWTNCGDNKIYSRNRDTVFISRDVYGCDGALMTKDTLLPTFGGAPTICTASIPPDFDTTVVRGVDFINGGFEFYCTDLGNDRGDLNLNGVPFEINEDLYLFMSYFLKGDSVFTIDLGRQTAASDINADGAALTLQDVEAMSRLIEGIPLHPEVYINDTFPGTATFIETDDYIRLRTDFEKPVGAMVMTFYAPNVTQIQTGILPEGGHVKRRLFMSNDTLRIIIYGLEISGYHVRPGPYIDTGQVDVMQIVYEGDRPQLVSCEAAGFFGEPVDVATEVIEGSGVVIAGDCGETIEIYGDSGLATFENIAGIPEDTLIWSVEYVDPIPEGAYSINNGVLVFHPAVSDLGKEFYFRVRVTNQYDESDECRVEFVCRGIAPFEFAVDVVEDQYQGHHTYLNVTKTRGTEELLGFDFLLGYDASVLAIINALPGELFDENGSYQWEYFTYRFDWNGNCGLNCPTGLLRAVGLADINNGAHHPLSFDIPDGTVLFTLDYLVSNNHLYAGFFAPVRFYWMDCGDNAAAFRFKSDEPGDVRVGLSDHVFNCEIDSCWEITDVGSDFPTYSGAPDRCLGGNNQPLRFVDFRNGGMGIREADSIHYIGDLNLNGVAYEIHDAVIFSNYFLEGLSAFIIDADKQIKASDINGDGIPLTIEDFTMLLAVIIGDALPLPDIDSTFSGTVIFSESQSDIEVSTRFHMPVGGMRFVYHIPDAAIASVMLLEGAQDMDVHYNVCYDTLKVLVYSFDGAKIPVEESDIVRIAFSGEKPELVSVSAAGYYGRKVDLTVFSVGYRTGDLDGNGGVNLMDFTLYLYYLKYGGSVFTINEEAQTAVSDINGDGIPLTPEDAMLLLIALYGGLLPDPCPGPMFDGTVRFIGTDSSILIRASFDKPFGLAQIVFNAPGLSSCTIEPDDKRAYLTRDTLRILAIRSRVACSDYGFECELKFSGPRPELISCAVSGCLAEKVNITTIFEDLTGVEGEAKPNLPAKFALYQNYPNPFNFGTSILFDLPTPSEWQIQIINIVGRAVRCFSGSDPAGTVNVQWDGRNSAGSEVASGIYFYRLRAGDFTASKKMILLK